MSEDPKTQTLVDILRNAVHPDYVSERKGLSYVTGRYVKQTLNQLFGPLGWSYTIVDQYPIGDFEGDSAQWFCHLRLSVTVGDVTTTRDGMAVGHGLLVTRNGKVSPGRANEVIDFAAAESVTDALKRAAVSLGGVFGLSLYPLKAGSTSSAPAPRPAPSGKSGLKAPKNTEKF